jgi:hypothetical protein
MREGLVDSEKVNALSYGAEVFYVHLILKADDFGRFDARVPVLRSYLFPLRPIRDTDISRWIAECEKAGLIAVHGTDGKRYIEILRFNQRIRSEKSKFHDPERDDGHLTDKCQTPDGHLTDKRQTPDGHPHASVVCDCVCEGEDEGGGRQRARAHTRGTRRAASPDQSQQPPAAAQSHSSIAAEADGDGDDSAMLFGSVLTELIESGIDSEEAARRADSAIKRCDDDGWATPKGKVRNRVKFAVALAKQLESRELET